MTAIPACRLSVRFLVLALLISGVAAGEGRRSPRIPLGPAVEIPTVQDSGRAPLARPGPAESLSLVSGDFDEDGVPDLVVGSRVMGRGVLALRRGNVEALYPGDRRGEPVAPFLGEVREFQAPDPPEFVGAGDFDGDGHLDVVSAARGANRLWLLTGDGHGALSAAAAIELPGPVTAFAAGEMDRVDGLADVVVAIGGEGGPRVLLFEGPEGALKAAPETLPLPAPAAALALGDADGDGKADLAVAAGHELVIFEGRARRADAPVMKMRSYERALRSVAIGRFISPARTGVAVLTERGDVELLNEELGQPTAAGAFPLASGFQNVKVSTTELDDLLVMEPRERRLRVAAAGDEEATLEVSGEPVAALAMRLGPHAAGGVVLLERNSSAPLVSVPLAGTAYLVTTTGDNGDNVNPLPGSLRKAVKNANATPDLDYIYFQLGHGPRTIALQAGLTLTQPVSIDGTFDTGWTIGNPMIELDGSLAGGDGLTFASTASGSSVKALILNRFPGSAIVLNAGGCAIEGNFIGTNAAAAAALPNHGHGVLVTSASNTVGGTIAEARNVISGNVRSGVLLSLAGATGNSVRGNRIGTNAAGTADLGNGAGVDIDRASGNTVGGTTAGARNVVSGNGVGVRVQSSITPGLATANVVQGNYVGTDINGNSALGNSIGILLLEAGANTVGGTVTGAGNVISGNVSDGVEIVALLSPLSANGNTVHGNRIGVGAGGGALGNGAIGIHIHQGDGNAIGGTAAGEANVIANSGSIGVGIASGVRNAIRHNSISGSGALGIDLGNDGHTDNDAGDGDAGANGRQNFPVLTSVQEHGTGTKILGTLDGPPSRDYAVDFFTNEACDASGFGEGKTYLGSTTVHTDHDGHASFQVEFHLVLAVGTGVAATATDPDGNTSEFSLCYLITCENGPSIVSNTNASGPGSLRAAIDRVNGCHGSHTGEIHFTIPGTGVQTIHVSSALPEIQHKVILDGTKQHGHSGAPLVELRGNGSFHGLVLRGADSHVKGLIVSGFGGTGIQIEAGGAVVEGCYIGTNTNGTGVLYPNTNGIWIQDAASCRIGGTQAHQRNVISGNRHSGVVITGPGSTGNIVEGNRIGTDASGTAIVSNQFDGVRIMDGASDNTVGGHDLGSHNLLSGNYQGAGVALGSFEQAGLRPVAGNVVIGNLIGTDVTGSYAIPNNKGVAAIQAGRNTIGGRTHQARNLISGNASAGVYICRSSGLVVEGNLIGTAADGMSPLPNSFYGINLTCVDNNANILGGPESGAGNIIAFNDHEGVVVGNGQGTRIRGNSMFGNSQYGPGSGITVASYPQASPLLTSVTVHGGGTTVEGELNSSGATDFTIDFYANEACHETGYGEGRTYLGKTIVTTDGDGYATFSFHHHLALHGEHLVTATATRDGGNTSEFSNCQPIQLRKRSK